MGSAVNVRVARHIGAQDSEGASAAIRTSFVICLTTGCIIMALCLLSARFMLELLGTKDDLIDGAILYFRIYALGMPALGVFNFGNGVLSANGDTKRPLAYLMIAGILNVMFNLFFVIVCGMAEDGVALASIITQYVSAILILMHMARQTDDSAFHLRELKKNISHSGKVSNDFSLFRRFCCINRCFRCSCGKFSIVHGVQAAIGFRAAAIGEKGDLPETHPVQPRTESKRPCRLTRAKPASKGSDRALSV